MNAYMANYLRSTGKVWICDNLEKIRKSRLIPKYT